MIPFSPFIHTFGALRSAYSAAQIQGIPCTYDLLIVCFLDPFPNFYLYTRLDENIQNICFKIQIDPMKQVALLRQGDLFRDWGNCLETPHTNSPPLSLRERAYKRIQIRRKDNSESTTATFYGNPSIRFLEPHFRGLKVMSMISFHPVAILRKKSSIWSQYRYAEKPVCYPN